MMLNTDERFRQEHEAEQRIWTPAQVLKRHPVDGDVEPDDRSVLFNNTFKGGIEVADEDTLRAEVLKAGRVKTEPEIARARDLGIRPAAVPADEQMLGGYSDTYWTHFNYRSDVGKAVVRVQKKFPNLTYANTYFCHPPVYGRKYEFVSVDYWGGGIVNGRYVGYRGKPIGYVIDGWKVFNAAFNDPYLPNIAWIIFGGRMWSRGYGWGPAPGGPPDSDPGHYLHVHITYVL